MKKAMKRVMGSDDEDHQQVVGEPRPWSDLPPELMDLISRYLSIADLARLRAVCRSWQSVGKRRFRSPSFDISMISSSPSPILITTEDDRCTFYDPVHHYVTHSKEIPELVGTLILGSGHGWLVLTRQSDLNSVFLFNLATNTRIELPRCKPPPYLQHVWLSSAPNSSGCYIIGVNELAVGLWIIKRGDKDWTYHNCHKPNFLACAPVRFQGELYCMDYRGRIFVIDPSNFDARWMLLIEQPLPLGRWKRIHSFEQAFLVECEGELLAIFLSDYDNQQVSIFGLVDPENETWQKIESLEDKMLFVSNKSSFIMKATARGIANKMYLPKFTSAGYGVVYDIGVGAYITLLTDCDEVDPARGRSRFVKELKLSSAWCQIDPSTTCDEVLSLTW
ncbi:hypothetical protein CDL15_Pgr012607 [Punica granatum]|nr:hypothetical protein CDL15_Pgr012607 [Punica granatum]